MNECYIDFKNNHFLISSDDKLSYYHIEPLKKMHDIKVEARNICLNSIYYIYVDKKNNVIISKLNGMDNIGLVSFNKTISHVECNEKYLGIALEQIIYIYDVNYLNVMHTMNGSHILFKQPEIKIGWDNENIAIEKNVKIASFKPHTSNLRHVCLNYDGTSLATVSEKGTIIRIWNTSNGKLMSTLRRGFTNASITNMCFSKDGRWLCVATLTIHVFDLLTSTYIFPHWNSLEIKLTSIAIGLCFEDLLIIITKEGDYTEYEIKLDPIKIVAKKYVKLKGKETAFPFNPSFVGKNTITSCSTHE